MRASLGGEVYRLSSYLRGESARRAAAAWLGANLSAENAIGVRRSANRAVDGELAARVDAFIQDNFNSIISTSTEFTALPTVQVLPSLPAHPPIGLPVSILWC